MKIYLYDLIGIKSGMNYYLESFKKLLNDNNIEVTVRSNYINEGDIFFHNIFSGNTFIKIIKLILNLIKFKSKILFSKNISIFLFYGTYIDILFFVFCFRSKNVFIDVHESVLLDNKSVLLKIITPFLFKFSENKVIYHSQKSKNSVLEFGFKNELIFVPHFKYKINKNIEIKNVGFDVINAINNTTINYLFFGNIRESKGVLELLNLIEYFNNKNKLSNVNFIIAGQDIFKLIDNSKYNYVFNLKIITKHINDDELVYLFNNSNFILLPYKNISQSGVLEMAIHFEKQIITSNLEYFKSILEKHKTFGYLFNLNDKNAFLKVIEESCTKGDMVISKKI